ALSFGLISPSKSTRLTPLLWEHISTISFPFSKRYLNKLFSAEPQRCTDDLIYLLTKTNQKKFVADFSVDFFEQNQEFLFEFIYKSLKLDNGEAIKIVVENTKKNNSVTDLLRSYRQLLKVPSKQPYIPTHAMYLKNFAGEYYKYAKEVSMSYEAFSLFYKFNDLRELAESDKSLNEILKINYGEQLNTQIIEMFNIIVEFAQDVKNYDIVENFRDKQYYLSESRIKLYDLSAQAREVLHEPEKSIFLEIFEKWQGIITSEAKSLRGPADIAISILNKNLSVNDENEWQPIVVKIKNTGLSPAENIMLAFLDNENIEVGERTKEVRLLGIGEEAKLEFSIKSIGHSASLRINIDTSFDDFERKGKLRVFADILSVSSPSFEYKKVLNPYIVGTPLKNEKIFVGRSHALKFAEDNLSSGSQNNILIYFGQRRIGKSSILYQLMNSSLNDEYVFVYIDCQGFADADTARLLYRLCRDIRSSLSKEQILIEEPALDRFKENTFIELDDYLDKVELALNDDESPSRKKVVLMFDEYEFLEYMVKSEKVSSEIFNKLRNLMQHRNKSFAFIFVGTHRLTELTEDYWSFLFNIALYYEIGTLTEKEAKNLIVKPVEDYIKYDELAIDKIIRITGNHPYFIQVLCRLIVNYCNEHLKGYINLKDLNNVLEDAVEGSTAHVKYLFSDYSTKSEQEILTFLSRTTDDTKLFASPAEISRFAGENGFTYDIVTVQEILSGLKNKKLVREGGELGDLLGFEYEFLRLWIEKHVKIQNGFINIT
ncbi:MAG TPA: ATP-binding protein, partial [Sphingobacteriaceae bacterium]